MDISNWTARKRNYELDYKRFRMEKSVTASHPLSAKPSQVKPSADPLKAQTQTLENIDVVAEDPYEIWRLMQKNIMDNFNLEQPGVVAEKEVRRATIKAKNESDVQRATIQAFKPIEKGKGTVDIRRSTLRTNRLSVLEEIHKGPAAVQGPPRLNLQEFTAHAEILNREMLHSWHTNDRVKTLKIAIQSAKMLRDADNEMTYPAKVSGILEILLQFGTFVYDRLKQMNFNPENKANFDMEALGDSFEEGQILEATKDTTMNWFMKTSCIRELLPRIYIEIALFKCYRFLHDVDMKQTFARIAKQIRGIAHPVISTYLYMFLSRIGLEVMPNEKEYLFIVTHDMLEMIKYLPNNKMGAYLPAIQWVYFALGKNAPEGLFEKSVELLISIAADQTIVFKSIIDAFPSHQISKQVTSLITIIKRYTLPADFLMLYSSLGNALIDFPPKNKYEVLNDVWQPISQTSGKYILDYLEASSIYIEFILKCFTHKEANILLDDVLRHFKEASGENNGHGEVLAEIMLKLVLRSDSLATLLSLDSFLPLLDQFNLQTKTSICEKIIEHYCKTTIETTISDHTFIHALFTITKIIHDAIDVNNHSQVFIQRMSDLICRFIRKIDFGRDLEQHLQVLTEARGSFINLDTVTEQLCYSVLNLTMKAHGFVKGRHTQKTHSFIKACIGYVHITIPSLDSVSTQFRLFIQSAHVALVNALVGESEGLIKAAIAIFPELEDYGAVEGSLLNLIGFLVVLPDNPESRDGFFVIPNGVYNVVNDLSNKNQKLRSILALLAYLSTQMQDKLPFRIFRVDSNDALMAGNATFANDYAEFLSVMLGEMFNYVVEHERTTEKDKILIMQQIHNTVKLIFAPTEQVTQLLSKIESTISGKVPEKTIEKPKYQAPVSEAKRPIANPLFEHPL